MCFDLQNKGNQLACIKINKQTSRRNKMCASDTLLEQCQIIPAKEKYNVSKVFLKPLPAFVE